MPASAARFDGAGGDVRFRRLALFVVSAAVVLVVSQQLMLSVALPQITADLHASAEELQWIVDGYPICLAALLLTGGALGDRLGRRSMLIAGLAIMAFTNLATAVMPSAGGVIGGRAACAVGAALVFPATLSTLTAAFSAEHRTKAVAVWSIAAVLGAFSGILAAGVLLQFWTWRSTFWVSAALAVALLPAVRVFVPESGSPKEAVLDPVGSLLACAGVGATTYGIIAAGEHGMFSVRVLTGLLGGLALCSLFVRRQWLAERPLLNVRALTNPIAGIGLFGTTAMYFMAYATAVVAVQYLSIVHGQSALQIGTTMLSYGTLLVPLTFLSTRIAARVGPGPLVMAGLVVIAASDVGLSTLEVHSGLGRYVVWAIVFGAGLGLMQAPAIGCIASALPSKEQGLASALNDITRELGAALGIAVSGAVLTANLSRGKAADEGFMDAWTPTCLTLTAAALLSAGAIGFLHRRVPRPISRRRHTAPERSGWPKNRSYLRVERLAGRDPTVLRDTVPADDPPA